MDSFSLSHNLPVVIKNKINNWKILRFNEDDWCNEFKNSVLQFREGDNSRRMSPYWEKLCRRKELTLRDFLQHSVDEQDSWLYFDYKYMKEFFSEKSRVCDGINWSDLGLKNFQGIDSTLWIGNKGAHTPCHVDSYGCNFIAQISGRKLWILIPPEESEALKPTRVPYEESSIYSSLNFYTPTNELLEIKEAYKIILSPGDVLFVPRHWWHYVENLDVAISVNLWVPLDMDHESRLEESLIRHFVFCVCQNLSHNDAMQILNPNEESLLTEQDILQTMQKCVENCIQHRRKEIAVQNKSNDILSVADLESLHQCDLKFYVTEKSKQFNYDPSASDKTTEESNILVSFASNLINAYAHSSNINAIKERLLSQLE